ncbi:MAG TPA: hypothetical protein VFU86_15780 [Terriglobales bacterium]|nr:hypothetical protein [Terriglobales bacterium]
MAQQKLEQCVNGCCLFVDGMPVSVREYEEAIRRHPGHYPGVKQGQRNAVLETIIACRKV